jgi:hypothetical protein
MRRSDSDRAGNEDPVSESEDEEEGPIAEEVRHVRCVIFMLHDRCIVAYLQ